VTSKTKKNTKKMLCVWLALCLVFSLAACGSRTASSAENGKPTAAAYLNQNQEAAVKVTADLSGGWSVDFD
jgi:uncharacterized lipoprotein YehR (DUF1307 family)